MAAKTSKEETILEAATELFLEYGFKDVSISKIVEKAGCSRETVYRYYSNKEDIFSKIIANLMKRYLTVMKTAIAVDTDNLRDGLISWSESLLQATTDEKYIRFRRLVISETSLRPEHGELYFNMTYRQGAKAVEDYFEIFQKKGKLMNIDKGRLSSYFVGMILYEMMHERVLGARQSYSKAYIKKHCEKTVDDFLAGYAL